MCQNCDYTIHGAQHHFGWDNSIAPAERVEPGAQIAFHCMDSSAGQLGPTSTVEDVKTLDFGKINPVSGPIFVEGAEPGDALKITIDSFAPREESGSAWGWTANIPGFGLLADQFTDPALTVWKYDAKTLEPALFGEHGRVPLKPFCGTIGNALAENGLHSIVPPRRVAAISTFATSPPERCSTCRSRWRGRCSRSVTPMPRRAMARSAAPRSKVRWTRCSPSIW